MKNWGFASQLTNVYLGSTIAKFLPGPLAKNFCWLVQPLNENLGFRLPAGKVCLGSTIAKFLPGALAKNFLLAGKAFA